MYPFCKLDKHSEKIEEIKLLKIGKIVESMKQTLSLKHFYEYSNIIAQAPDIPHFKGLDLKICIR